MCASQMLVTICDEESQKSRTQNRQNAMLQMPGEMGLRNDRATFHLDDSQGQPEPINKKGHSFGPTYYNIRPMQAPVSAMTAGLSVQPSKQRKHVMKILHPQQISTKKSVGPVTGLPITTDERVILFNLNKQYEKDNKVTLQIEARLAKQQDLIQKEACTQYQAPEIEPAKIPNKSPNKSTNKSKKQKGKGGKAKKNKKWFDFKNEYY